MISLYLESRSFSINKASTDSQERLERALEEIRGRTFTRDLIYGISPHARYEDKLNPPFENGHHVATIFVSKADRARQPHQQEKIVDLCLKKMYLRGLWKRLRRESTMILKPRRVHQ